MGLALSTSWNAFRHTRAETLLSEIRQAGFDEIELSFNLTVDLVEGIARLIPIQNIRVVSLHNFCPIPDGVERRLALPDHFSMSSLDEEERARSVAQTKKTIDTAARLGARAVVLHTGRVQIEDRTRDLIALFEAGKARTKSYQDLKADMIRERTGRSRPFLDSTLRSLEELNAYARDRGLLLGVETRFYYREIPWLDEIPRILERFRGSQIRYWHDCGHAQLMENLGFCRHEDFLEAGKDALLGVHLHGIRGCSDHQAPVASDFDFKRLLPYISRDTIKVIEAHHPAAIEEIRESKRFLEAAFDGKI